MRAPSLPRSPMPMPVPMLVLIACAALAACREPPPADPAADAGAIASPASADSLVVPPPDAGPDELAEAQRLALQLVHHPDAPRIRLDLRVDLKTGDVLGLQPVVPVSVVQERLGPPGLKRKAEGKNVMAWRWPDLGVEALVQDDQFVSRVSLEAVDRRESGARVFTGAVLVGKNPLNQVAPSLSLKEIVNAVGLEGGRILSAAGTIEVGWRHGADTLYCAFDDATRRLQLIFIEQNSEALWAEMKPLSSQRKLWEAEGSDGGQVEFAPLPDAIAAADLDKMGAVARGLPDATLVFDHLETAFLPPGTSLRRVSGGRVAILRVSGLELVVLERGATWEARMTGNPATSQKQVQAAVARLRKLFGPAPRPR